MMGTVVQQHLFIYWIYLLDLYPAKLESKNNSCTKDPISVSPVSYRVDIMSILPATLFLITIFGGKNCSFLVWNPKVRFVCVCVRAHARVRVCACRGVTS